MKHTIKKFILLTAVLSLSPYSALAGKIQKQGVKTSAECTAAGATDATCLIEDAQIYDTTNGQKLSTSIATGALGGGSSGATKNYVKNPGAESNTTDVTASGSATVTRNTTTPLYGSGDFSITLPNNATDYVEWTLNTLDNALKNQNCELDFYYTASSIGSAVKFEVLQGSNVVIRSDLLAVNSNPQLVKVNVPCGDLSGASKVRVTNQTGNSGTSAIKVDQVIYGAATNVGSVAQAEMFGVVTLNSCSGGGLSTSSTSYTTVSSSGCSYTAEGKASAPPSNTFGASFTGLPSGEYEIEVDGTIYNSTTDACYARFTDGTNFSQELYYRAAGQLYVPKISGRFRYDSSKGALNIQLQLKAGGTNSCALFAPSQFRIKRFPTSSEIAYRPELQALSWSGYHDASYSNWNFTSTGAFADPASNTNNGNDVTELTNRNLGTVTSYVSGARKLPGIVITPKKTGRFYVCAVTGPANAGTSGGSFQLNDLTNSKTIAEAAVADTSNNSSVTLCGILDIPNLSAITLAVQGKKGAAGTMLITSYNTTTRMMNWSIFALDQNIPAPVLVGSVTSGSTGAERIERVRFGGASERSNCTASPCTIYSQSGSWVSSVTRNATGNYTVNIASGVFSVEPTCSGNAKAIGSQNTALIPVDATGSATSKRFDVMRLGAAGTNDDAYVEYVCYGPR